MAVWVALATWVAVAILLSLFMGRAIRRADRRAEVDGAMRRHPAGRRRQP